MTLWNCIFIDINWLHPNAVNNVKQHENASHLCLWACWMILVEPLLSSSLRPSPHLLQAAAMWQCCRWFSVPLRVLFWLYRTLPVLSRQTEGCPYQEEKNKIFKQKIFLWNETALLIFNPESCHHVVLWKKRSVNLTSVRFTDLVSTNIRNLRKTSPPFCKRQNLCTVNENCFLSMEISCNYHRCGYYHSSPH